MEMTDESFLAGLLTTKFKHLSFKSIDINRHLSCHDWSTGQSHSVDHSKVNRCVWAFTLFGKLAVFDH